VTLTHLIIPEIKGKTWLLMSDLLSDSGKEFPSQGKGPSQQQKKYLFPSPLQPFNVLWWLLPCFCFFPLRTHFLAPGLLPGILPTPVQAPAHSVTSLAEKKRQLRKHKVFTKDKNNCFYYSNLMTLHVILIIDMDEFQPGRSQRSQRGVDTELDYHEQKVPHQHFDSSESKNIMRSCGFIRTNKNF
jgi:hypothetical protein